ncbi:FAD-dependent monooxygenase [Streptomyces sp. SP18CS02]|uniref:FAD-dependent monooxygenase n=1 Tax=Streptomyces sp. SP18CS02 TaxID=3002531 RepID=UPI002E7A54EF|nr:FAD-dependent monooxygenase [Streptomyces sp. SP18CS02]MEE1756662.1 FAD-dependent monooxygenase [Streptomyces sp. SP18CS02]
MTAGQDGAGVLIVGAGPVGLTAAAGLLQQGIPVRLIDRSERPNPHAKAITLWPRALEALHRLGAADEILERGLALHAQNYHSAGKQVARLTFDQVKDTRFPFAVSLPQQETEEALRHRFEALGGKTEFGVRLTGLRQDADGVTAELTDGEGTSEVRADWLIGADGAHSTVRTAIGTGYVGETYPQQFLLSDGPCDTPLAQDEAHYFMTAKGVLVVVGLPGGNFRVFTSLPPDAEIAEDIRAEVQRAASERCPVPIELTGEHRTGVFRVHRKVADRFRDGRVLLAGDAAHIHSPAGGQGLNTGIEDASTLAWRLAAVVRGERSEAFLDRWEDERRAVARGVLDDTDLQTRLWTMKGWKRNVRDAALMVGERTGLLDRFITPRQTQLSLVHDGPRRAAGRLREGARLPDVPLSPARPAGGVSGERLHDLLDGGRPLLLVFAADSAHAERTTEAVGAAAALAAPGHRTVVVSSVPAPEERPGAPVLADPAGALHAALGLRGPTVCLVRPDAVVSTVSPLGDLRLVHDLVTSPPHPHPVQDPLE